MKPEQQRIAIAGWCGWEKVYDQYYESRTAFVKGGERYAPCDLPDFLNDLNAIHEAESKLADFSKYGKELAKIRGFYDGSDWPEIRPWDVGNICHATAAQRSEALLRTIGRWIDSPQERPK